MLGLKSFRTCACFFGVFVSIFPVRAEDQAALKQGPLPEPVCPQQAEIAPEIARSEVYKGMPFQPGEEARYVLKYGLMKVHVGYGFLRVQAPTKYKLPLARKGDQLIEESRWHRVFSAEAYTGDWYKMVFAAHDTMQAFSRPWDFGVSKFYINQDEEKPLVRRFRAEKWLDFNHALCRVQEKMVDHKKNKEEAGEHFVEPGAIDALGALYKLRTFDFQIGRIERFLVYTSEKNWWLEATPLAEEKVKTPYGEHRAVKLAVQSYIGKELQQKGKLFVWIASDMPEKPMLRVEGKVTFGSVYLELDRFTPGVAL